MIKKWAERFFRWYCHPDYYEDIRGDLDELYKRNIAERSVRHARWAFAMEVFVLFRPAIIRPFRWPFNSNIPDMFNNYFKISFRNLIKYPSNTFIHILGLALGLTAFLFIDQYISFEKTYDNFHPLPNQLYRLTTDEVREGQIQVRDAMSFAPSGLALQEEVPEIISHTTTLQIDAMVFRKDEEPVEERSVIAVDSNFLNLFGYEVIAGNKETMLVEPYTVVLTESQADKYFGNNDPVGQSIEMLGSFNRPFKVTGVIRDVPANTHYDFNTLVSLRSFQERVEGDAWNGYNYYTYLRVQPGTDREELQAKMPALSRKYMGDQSRLVFNLQPVTDIHLYSDFTFEPQIHGSAKAVRFLSVISMFILIIAWVNYINLSTARAMERAREVGLRKVVGAQRKQLMGQFLVESFLTNFAGAFFALLLSILLLPYFNELVGKTILASIFASSSFMWKLLLFFLIGTMITGFYPALVMSSFRPAGVLKGTFSRTGRGSSLRKALVVVQFAASLMLVAGTVIIYQQIRYMTGKDLGIDTAQVIGFANPPNRESYEAFTEELRRTNTITAVGGIGNLPGGGSSEIGSSSGGVRIVGKTDLVESTVYVTGMDDRAIPTLDLEVLHGRNFDRERAVDSTGVILNEALLQLLNVSDPEQVVGQYFQFGRNPDNARFPIVGIINDYNRSTLKGNVEPTVFFHQNDPSATLIKLKESDLNEGLDQVENIWNRFFPDAPFTYAFLDQRFEQLYQEDKKFGYLFLNFALLAIFVASMGLFGLSSYMSLQRTKEVGVRKVLGASTSSIVLLFFKDFLWLIVIAIAIGTPLTFLGMNDWLNSYAYRIHFPWWIMVATILLVAVLAFLTVSFQTLKLALLNPAKTIRHE